MKVSMLGVISIVAFIVLISLAACGGAPEPTVPRPTRAPVVATQPSQVVPTRAAPSQTQHDDLARVKQDQKLVVGTAADYAPFEFYASDNSLDGFDIAVIHEVAKRMNIPVEIQDYAFDGLSDALKLGQIDAVAAALSITSARQHIEDFSVPYYLGEDAALARSDADFQIHSASDTIGRKVGVQRGTVYESWLAEAYLNAGIASPDSNLVLFENANDMVQALRNKQVDVLILGSQPALTASKGGDLKLVGQAMNAQQYGIAARKGSSLVPEFNRVLLGMYQDGSLLALMQHYLELDSQEALPLPEVEAQPAATPVPAQPVPVTVTPQPGPTCVMGMAFVSDVNLDDQNMKAPPPIQAGQPFNKIWRIQNNGTCDWQPDFALVYTRGNVPDARMGGSRVPIAQVVKPGQTIDVSANLVAPNVPGIYQGFWQMRNSANGGFGKTLWVGIMVPGAQPIPVPPIVPNLRLRADNQLIYQGQCTVIRWDVDNATAVAFIEGGNALGVNAHDSRTVCPQATTTYTLQASLTNNQTVESSLPLTVVNGVPPPVPTEPTPVPPKPGGGGGGGGGSNRPRIQSFTVNHNKIKKGGCVNLHWATKNTPVGVTLQRNAKTLIETGPANGTHQDCPPKHGLFTYTLIAAGEGIGDQAVQQSLTVQVGK